MEVRSRVLVRLPYRFINAMVMHFRGVLLHLDMWEDTYAKTT